MARQRATRRQILHGAASAAAAAALWPRTLRAQAEPRVVIVGGGFAGAACARALRAADAKLAITLVEARSTYTAPPLSNGVLGGLRQLSQQQFGYDKIAAAGIKVAIAPQPPSMRRPAASRCRAATPCPMTGWCWRPASNCASMRSPATAKPPRRRRRMPGPPTRRNSNCCAGRLSPWPMTASSPSSRRPIRRAVRPVPTSAPA